MIVYEKPYINVFVALKCKYHMEWYIGVYKKIEYIIRGMTGIKHV